jgi:hypothetical protein
MFPFENWVSVKGTLTMYQSFQVEKYSIHVKCIYTVELKRHM